jgi:hypothetical protein
LLSAIGATCTTGIERRSLLNAELAAREMGKVTLEEALQLVALHCEQDDPRAERAMVKWLGRLFTEKQLGFACATQCVELVAALREVPGADRDAPGVTARRPKRRHGRAHDADLHRTLAYE